MSGERGLRVWAGVWSTMLALLFGGVTSLTVGLWLLDRTSAQTSPVGDLSFLALGAIIAVGFASPLRAGSRGVAGALQALLGALALSVAGLLGLRIEPLAGGLVFTVAAGILVALVADPRAPWSRPGVSLPLAALTAMAVVPVAAHTAAMLDLARAAGPSCFMGQCAAGDRLAEMAASDLAIVLIAGVAALRLPGWTVPARSTGLAAVLVGGVSIVLPDEVGALGPVWGGLLGAWGLAFLLAAHWSARPTFHASGR
jgi:hypothetical protein